MKKINVLDAFATDCTDLLICYLGIVLYVDEAIRGGQTFTTFIVNKSFTLSIYKHIDKRMETV